MKLDFLLYSFIILAAYIVFNELNVYETLGGVIWTQTDSSDQQTATDTDTDTDIQTEAPLTDFVRFTHRFAFVGGMKKSGTSLLMYKLLLHPLVSGFYGGKAPLQEGQFLQTLFPPISRLGGPAKFCYRAYKDESSPILTAENRAKLFAQWSRYWNLNKGVLMERSTINLVQSRFLQTMFYNCSSFVFVVRHPLSTSLSTMKLLQQNTSTSTSTTTSTTTTTLFELIQHWVDCHELLRADLKYLLGGRALIVYYEHMMQAPTTILKKIHHFLRIPYIHVGDTETAAVFSQQHPSSLIWSDKNPHYWDWWKNNTSSDWNAIVSTFEERVNKFGYSLLHFETNTSFVTENYCLNNVDWCQYLAR